MGVAKTGPFDLLNFATFENEFMIKESAFTESRNYIYGIIINNNKKIHLVSIPKAQTNKKYSISSLQKFALRELEWFSNETLTAKCSCFNPIGDFSMVVTENCDLYVISITSLLQDNQVLSKSGLSWDKEIVTKVFNGPRVIRKNSVE